ncbi:polysaccharide biosynthesis protein [Bariatricus massiliensis]|uniref:Polysaccharide biosynthesis protein n=1 Tax=Bariatricus massiliensis TaxID=1745713 RepID=A0ABS8DE24_9FIRM|nr:polysaccharide biosynthesis protein [Bariatricus massiliensis]MCB7303262.1 polysaccharide biosynthesis protein [Bariatricus massiliensis]MCB7373394.1 polysaccharide biosynthesis protein [Bariatricus massiliensis]MCB7386064.1 polysaccharide biosynthesis protein [Bariatricus massiliensis]MCB7410226.1 polysaccharide biosynthesis protein [Bariatricus massiliensis]MCQ5252490.1 polysaccharide biosynthesis protein [Bariatricus massiliensis]
MAKKKKSKGRGFLVQGTILAAAGIITKVIGAIYRIPMLNIMGLEGQGYYDIAFQVYSIALLISSYSLPLAVSKLVSARMAKGQKRNAFRVFKAAMIFAVAVGTVIMIVVFIGSDVIADHVMGAKLSSYALRVLAPGLLIVAIMGVLRGYFQGIGTMIPTAISQVLEQILNAVVSILGAAMLMEYGKGIAEKKNNELLSSAYSAAGGTLGTVAGALIGLVFLVLCYAAYKNILKRQLRSDKSKRQDEYQMLFKLLLITIAPVILSTAIYNASNVIDSAMFNKIMGAQGKTEKWCARMIGKLGEYYTLFNVPLAVANALGASMMPGLVRAVESRERRLIHNRIYMAVRYTMLIAIPSAVGFFVIGKPILDFLWPNVENSVQGRMLMIGAISLVFYSLSTITNAVLQGLNRMMKPVKNATVALVLHIVSLFIMLVVFKWGIYSIIVSKIVFSLCMCIMNSHDIREAVGYVQERQRTYVIPAIAAAIMGGVAFVLNLVLDIFMPGRLATLIVLIVAVIVYGVCLLKFGGLSEDELLSMPKGATLISVCKKLHLLNDNYY